METLLHGHTSAETAYIQCSYPFGRTIRCIQLYWVETAEKGAKKAEQRLVTCTTDRRWNYIYTDKIGTDGQDAADAWAREQIGKKMVPWNAAKGGTYCPQVLMFRDESTGHIAHVGVYAHRGADHFHDIRRRFFEQMDDDQRKRFEFLEKLSRRFNPESWAKVDAQQTQPEPATA